MTNWKTMLDAKFATVMEPMENSVGDCAFSAAKSYHGGGSVILVDADGTRSVAKVLLPGYRKKVLIDAWLYGSANVTHYILRDRHVPKATNAVGLHFTTRMFCRQTDNATPVPTYEDIKWSSFTNMPVPHAATPAQLSWTNMKLLLENNQMKWLRVGLSPEEEAGFGRCPLDKFEPLGDTIGGTNYNHQIEVEAIASANNSPAYLGWLIVKYGS